MAMYDGFKFFESLQYRNKCHECGKEMAAGSPGYGSNRTAARPGRWIFVCPTCYRKDQEMGLTSGEEEPEDELPEGTLEVLEKLAGGIVSGETTAEDLLEPKDDDDKWLASIKEAAAKKLKESEQALKDQIVADLTAIEEKKKNRPLLERLKDEAPWRLR